MLIGIGPAVHRGLGMGQWGGAIEDFDAGWAGLLADKHLLLMNGVAEQHFVLVGQAWSVPVILLEQAFGVHANATYNLPTHGAQLYANLSILEPCQWFAQKVRGVCVSDCDTHRLCLEVCSEKVP